MRRATILLVDEPGRTRDGLQEILKQQGFDVVPATTPAEARKAITKERFDILIADLQRPNPEAASDVIAAIRRSQPWAATVGLGDALDAQQVLGRADHVLEKPIAVKELLAVLSRAVAERRH